MKSSKANRSSGNRQSVAALPPWLWESQLPGACTKSSLHTCREVCQRPALFPDKPLLLATPPSAQGEATSDPTYLAAVSPALTEGLSRQGEAELPKTPTLTRTPKIPSCIPVQMTQSQLNCMNTHTFHIGDRRPGWPAIGRSSWTLRTS